LLAEKAVREMEMMGYRLLLQSAESGNKTIDEKTDDQAGDILRDRQLSTPQSPPAKCYSRFPPNKVLSIQRKLLCTEFSCARGRKTKPLRPTVNLLLCNLTQRTRWRLSGLAEHFPSRPMGSIRQHRTIISMTEKPGFDWCF